VVIFAPANTASAQQRHRPIGNNSDLYARWYGTRELLFHHRDPYGRDITREIQAGFYGRPLEPQNASDPAAQEGFNYPLYAAFLVAPFAGLSFVTAQAIFRWLLILAAACSVPLWMRALGCYPRLPLVLACMVLAAGAYPSVMEFYQQNLAALVIFILAAAMASLARSWHALAGFLLKTLRIDCQLRCDLGRANGRCDDRAPSLGEQVSRCHSRLSDFRRRFADHGSASATVCRKAGDLWFDLPFDHSTLALERQRSRLEGFQSGHSMGGRRNSSRLTQTGGL
jgi:hypothetical protein